MKLPWLNWGVYKYLKKNGVREAGELCSLRFTWQRPKRLASTADIFFYDSLVQYLYLARDLASDQLTSLKIFRVSNENSLFALAEFSNHVVAEIEMNEALPDSMPETYFLKGNYEHGHMTNQPLVGHFNVEGSVWADEKEMKNFLIDSVSPEFSGNISDNIAQLAKIGDCPEADCNDLVEAVKEALK